MSPSPDTSQAPNPSFSRRSFRDGAGIHSILVDPRDSNHVSVAVSCAGVIQSTHGGASWEYTKGLCADFTPNPESPVSQDAHLIAHRESAPDTVWQRSHCGIWKSDDEGQTWIEVSKEDGLASFDFTVAVDPRIQTVPGSSLCRATSFASPRGVRCE